jgi:hypothetical protein
MSLVGTYTLCKDGRYYEELIYWDENRNWFFCFDDDDPPELVVKKRAKLDPTEVLDKLDIPYTEIGSQFEASWLFGKSYKAFTKGYGYFIRCSEDPFPTPRVWDEYHAVYSKNPRREGVYYGGKP